MIDRIRVTFTEGPMMADRTAAGADSGDRSTHAEGATMSGPTMATAARPNGALGISNIPETLAAPTSSAVKPSGRTYDRYRVSVAEYVTFHRQGFLIVRGLVPPDDVAELRTHTEDLIHGR